jgi:TPP-dependent pyruvate/acetoin dehydrogenase alpha subunit
MRLSLHGVIPNVTRLFNPDVSLDIFRRMCLSRYFEHGVIRAVKEGFITYPIYLSLGQESIAAVMSIAIPDFIVFAQHRAHDIYLTFGGDPRKLRDELLGLPSGTSGGRAGSNCIQCHENNITMFGHHGLIGENVPLGVGAAFGSGKPVVCFFGDGAAEEDYVFAAMGFAATHKVPTLFVCVDNNLSILTTVGTRRTWRLVDVARSLGMFAYDLADDPWSVLVRALELRDSLPAVMNCHTCRAHWHTGIGIDGPPEWDRFALVKEELQKLGISEQANQIEKETSEAMEELWNIEQLRILLGR